MNLVEWWLKEIKFDDNELEMLQTDTVIESLLPKTLSQSDISNKLLNLLQINNLENSTVSFDSCATNIINQLFSKYVDDDTLVLTTGSEHPSVVNNLNKCKNVKVLINSSGLNKLDIDFKDYKKIFVYCISLSVGDSHYLSNDIFKMIKRLVQNTNLPSIFVLDAVQELFLLPRDYSIYDYVIGTSHAIIPNFNMGLLIDNKKFSEVSDNFLERGYTYYGLLNLILSKRSILEQFNFVMNDHFRHLMVKDKELRQSMNGPFTFNLLDYKKRLYGLNDIDQLVTPSEYSPATFRACPSAILPERFIDKLNKVVARLSI